MANNTIIRTVGEAPIDGTAYARQDADWVTIPPSGIEEAPTTLSYVRTNTGWELPELRVGAVGETTFNLGVDNTNVATSIPMATQASAGMMSAIDKEKLDNSVSPDTTDDLPEGTTNLYWKEAPADGKTYARRNNQWGEITNIQGFYFDDLADSIKIGVTKHVLSGNEPVGDPSYLLVGGGYDTVRSTMDAADIDNSLSDRVLVTKEWVENKVDVDQSDVTIFLQDGDNMTSIAQPIINALPRDLGGASIIFSINSNATLFFSPITFKDFSNGNIIIRGATNSTLTLSEGYWDLREANVNIEVDNVNFVTTSGYDDQRMIWVRNQNNSIVVKNCDFVSNSTVTISSTVLFQGRCRSIDFTNCTFNTSTLRTFHLYGDQTTYSFNNQEIKVTFTDCTGSGFRSTIFAFVSSQDTPIKCTIYGDPNFVDIYDINTPYITTYIVGSGILQPVWAGSIEASTPSITIQKGLPGVSVSKISTGLYQIDHNLGDSNYWVTLTGTESNSDFDTSIRVNSTSKGTNWFRVKTTSQDAVLDLDFDVVIFR